MVIVILHILIHAYPLLLLISIVEKYQTSISKLYYQTLMDLIVMEMA
jgi:hypothetical protein